jgi:hypothetical protein
MLSIDTTPPAVPHERLGRAARMAFGTTAAAAVALGAAACDTPPKDAKDPRENIAMPYGAPSLPEPDAGPPQTPSVTTTAPPKTTPPANMNKPYGAPPADGYDVFDV